jgi:hypothetical protein
MYDENWLEEEQDHAMWFTATPVATVTNADLLAEDLTGGACWEITIYDHLNRPKAEKAQAVFFEETGRLGIAWGGFASWADVENLPRGINMWLNDGEAWELAN